MNNDSVIKNPEYKTKPICMHPTNPAAFAVRGARGKSVRDSAKINSGIREAINICKARTTSFLGPKTKYIEEINIGYSDKR